MPNWYIPKPATEIPYLLPPCTLTMYNFSEYKRVGDIYRCQSFYTEVGGYKLLLGPFANGIGNGRGTHVSIFVAVVLDENDNRLKWNFNGEITIQLLNWREDREHVEHVVPIQYNADKRYKHSEEFTFIGVVQSFVCHNDLENKYINDDNLCFLVSKIIIDSKQNTS